MTTTLAQILSKDNNKQEEPPLQLTQGGSKVFSKLFARESSAAAPSFRVYYGVASAGSVPFLWESQPGTPKNDAISTATFPPLTPPPSYYTANAKQAACAHKSPAAGTGTGSGKQKQYKHYGFFSALLPKIILHRRSRSSSSSSASSSSSSASSSLSFRSAGAQSPASSPVGSRVFTFSAGGDSGEEPATCFSVRQESFRAFKGCRVATTVRTSTLSSVGGHGTTAATAPAAQRV